MLVVPQDETGHLQQCRLCQILFERTSPSTPKSGLPGLVGLCFNDHGSFVIFRSVSVRPKHLFDLYFDHDCFKLPLQGPVPGCPAYEPNSNDGEYILTTIPPHPVQANCRAQALMLQHGWPGNVRELENVISSACITAMDDFVDITDLLEQLQRR
jgi:hypothetical protein